MFRPFYAFIGYRYTRAKRKNHFISFISFTSIIGVALGVGVLITVLSVMNGFEREIRTQMLKGTPQITLGRITSPLNNWKSLVNELQHHPKIKGAAPFIYNQGMLTVQSGRVQGVMIKGIDPDTVKSVYSIDKQMKSGSLDQLKPGEYGIVLGKSLANALNVAVGDKLSLLAPEATVTPMGLSPRIKRFTVVGTFQMGDLYDANQVFVHLKDAQILYRLGDAVTGVQLKIDNEMEAPQVAKALGMELNHASPQTFTESMGDYWVSDWTRDFGNFFKALKIQKTVMMFIFLLIIAVAGFNLVSSLVMMVTDKRADIAILRTLGATPRTIMGIFMSQGSLVGLLGTVLGVGLGLFLSYNITDWVNQLQAKFDIELVSKDLYILNYLPTEVRAGDVITVVGLTLLISFISTLYPAWRASKIQPAEALRYE